MSLGRERFELASLGDLMQLLVDGWRIDRLHYADRSGAAGPPAAYVDLVRGAGERRAVYVPDDGRALSHRALVALVRETPGIWKHRSSDAIPLPDTDAATPPEEWGPVPEPFPQALVFGPSTLRAVVAVNQLQSVEGLDVALTSLERHDGGARLRFMCRASDAATRRRMSVLDVIAVDDAARLYRVACAESRPEGNRLEGAFAVAPAIPEEVGLLTVTVGTIGDEGRPQDSVPGPWVFPIRLSPRP
ncbi:MAG TPA: hypothetical protein VHK00_04085 [Miltoncostaeaceae bacterium]|nr:hypothetical protein [Miltoncostaeaceae bacterium]